MAMWGIRLSLALAVCVLLLAPTTSRAKPYPDHTIRFIVPFGAGGPTDVYTRALAEELRKVFNQPVVMDNRPGAGTVIGTAEAAKAAPDGYTLLMVSATQTVAETLNQNKPYKLMRDFVPVAALQNAELVMVVHPSVPAKTLQEFIALAKANPGKYNFGSSGPGSNYHMAAELVKNITGIDIVHVPYKGSTGARNDIVGGQIDVMFDSVPTMTPMIEAGLVRPLGTSGRVRSTVLPNVPTLSEAGATGYEAVMWIGVMAPAGTPQPIVDRLNTEINKILSRPDLIAAWQKQGSNPMVMKPTEFGDMMQAEIERWAKVIKENKITAD
ncbi:MAG: tripartite tricarboxylate transporter substrate binding protein [Xanthobacteraceae bacterium]